MFLECIGQNAQCKSRDTLYTWVSLLFVFILYRNLVFLRVLGDSQQWISIGESSWNKLYRYSSIPLSTMILNYGVFMIVFHAMFPSVHSGYPRAGCNKYWKNVGKIKEIKRTPRAYPEGMFVKCLKSNCNVIEVATSHYSCLISSDVLFVFKLTPLCRAFGIFCCRVWTSTSRKNVYTFLVSSSCPMMNCWKFCPKLKILRGNAFTN